MVPGRVVCSGPLIQRGELSVMCALFADRAKQSATGVSLGAFLKSDTARETITFRTQGANGAFARTISCFPGRLTVLKNASETVFETLRLREGVRKLDMRADSEDIHESEVQLCGHSDLVWDGESIAELLLQSGAPEAAIPQVIAYLGLDRYGAQAPRNLPGTELRKLAILNALYGKTRVLVYDRPFAQMDSASAEALASLMLNAAALSLRAIIVTGTESPPDVWRESELIDFYDIAQNDAVAPAILSQRNAGTMQQLMRTNRATDEAGPREIVTRPQSIHGPGQKPHAVEALKAEAISNPYIAELAAAEAIASQRRTPSGSSEGQKRQPTGKLTRVSRIQRLQHTPGVILLNEMWANFQERFKEPKHSGFVPTKMRIMEAQKSRRMRFILTAIATIELLMLIFQRCS